MKLTPHPFIRIAATSTLLLALIALTACIRDEIAPCPPLQVTLTVKDKNYFNAGQVAPEELKIDNLPLRQYVPNLYYHLRDAATGRVVEEQPLFTPLGDEQELPLAFCDCIPFGTYILTVWGGLNDTLTGLPEGEAPTSILLHPDGREGSDSYVSCDTLVYDIAHSHFRAELERTKGKLLIQVENQPQSVTRSQSTIGQLFAQVTHLLNYSGTTTVGTQHQWNEITHILLHTPLAPSTHELSSPLTTHFYLNSQQTEPVLTTKAINITLRRNELTVVKYLYNEEAGDYTIYVRNNDAWDLIYDVGIE